MTYLEAHRKATKGLNDDNNLTSRKLLGFIVAATGIGFTSSSVERRNMLSCPAGSYLTSNPSYCWSCDAASLLRECQKSRQHSKVIYLNPSCREIHNKEQFHSTEGFYLRALQRTSFSLCALVTLIYNHRACQSDNRDSTTRRFKWDACSLSAQRGSRCPEEICSGRSSRRSELELATKATLSWCFRQAGEGMLKCYLQHAFLGCRTNPYTPVHQQLKRSWRPRSFPEAQPLLCMGKAASVRTLYSKCFWEGLMW